MYEYVVPFRVHQQGVNLKLNFKKKNIILNKQLFNKSLESLFVNK